MQSPFNPLIQAQCLYSLEQVDNAIQTLAADICQQLQGVDSLVVLCVLKGGLVFTGRLLPYLTLPVQLEYVQVSRYGQNTQGGHLDWLTPVSSCLAGRHVLVCDDIFDEGKTLAALCLHLQQAQAASVQSAVLVEKCHTRKVPQFKPTFVGLQVPDAFVWGMGMDVQGFWRNAPGIFALKNSEE